MKSLSVKKSGIIVTALLLLLTVFSAGVLAGPSLKKITAYQNSNVKVKVNGIAIDESSPEGPMYTIVYDGHSYVSAKGLAEGMGGTVKWNNSTQTVEVSSGESDLSGSKGIPDKDNSNSENASTSTSKPEKENSNSENASTYTSKSDINTVPGYSSSTNVSTMYNDNKGAASHALTLYLEALKSGDTTKLKSWMKDNTQKNQYGTDSYEASAKSLDSQIKSFRALNESDVIDALVVSGIKEAKAKSFEVNPNNDDSTYSKTLKYLINAKGNGYKGTFGVYFSYMLNKETNKYYMSQLLVY
ncbi:stalk domain-containing protein [Paenibacillus macquariensis]|uniref:stalk domain-containing protein n=1 Tax=Paenibacillus macquariensis TaxID=948756 RepID=UPI0007C39918|nr:stalk domain-containing protein [Paenibacillus macquariensis]MEC0092245.1 stalk domain-containing protein [Paenibacillus macquariensis]OAB37209.1 hypothetical protein PMSM_03780 [Paenibacillus macquariensis subsp. macquariensis]